MIARRINQAWTGTRTACGFGTDLAHALHEDSNRLGK
jgi:hypothetical protein